MRTLIALLLVYSCGGGIPESSSHNGPVFVPLGNQPLIVVKPVTDDPVLAAYLHDFRLSMEARGIIVNYIGLRIAVKAKLSDPKHGGESYYNSVAKVAQIDLLEGFTRRLVYHELGHALWSLKHSTNIADIMYGEAVLDNRVSEEMLDRMAEVVSSLPYPREFDTIGGSYD